jgi:uncharacterized membrane protein YfcA
VIGTYFGKQAMAGLERADRPVVLGSSTFSLLDLVMGSAFLVLMGVVMTAILRETSGKGGAEAGSGDGEASTALARGLRGIRLRPTLCIPSPGLDAELDSLSVWIPLAVSACVGVLIGLMGVGGGFVLFPVLVYVLGVPTAVAIGTSAMQVLIATGYGSFSYFREGRVDLALVGLLLVGSLVGVRIGVYASHKIDARRIRKYFAFVIAAGMLLIAGDFVRQALLPADGNARDAGAPPVGGE